MKGGSTPGSNGPKCRTPHRAIPRPKARPRSDEIVLPRSAATSLRLHAPAPQRLPDLGPSGGWVFNSSMSSSSARGRLSTEPSSRGDGLEAEGFLMGHGGAGAVPAVALQGKPPLGRLIGYTTSCVYNWGCAHPSASAPPAACGWLRQHMCLAKRCLWIVSERGLHSPANASAIGWSQTQRASAAGRHGNFSAKTEK